jgi:subtilase family serine protease
MSIRRDALARPYYFSSSFNAQFLAPGDITTIYDVNALYSAGIDGTGQKLAVMGQTDIYLADITDFRTGFGLSAISCTTSSANVITACNDPHFKYVLGGADPGLSTNGDISEADLDIEWAGAIARGAQIIYVNSSDTFTSYYYAIDNTIAPVISLSYGVCEFGDNFVLNTSGQPLADEVELMKGNTEGITFLNSSGDSGAAECDPTIPSGTDPHGASAAEGLAVSYPASSPEVTGVGGTAISLTDLSSGTFWGATNGTDGGSALSYIPELEWNDDAEFVTYCQQHPGNFCTQGGNTKVTGWVPITNAHNVQTDFALNGGQGISSAGGGASNCAVQTSNNSACVSGFAQPSWQKVTISGQAAVRFTPDVALLATPNFPGYLFCTQASELGDGTTGSVCAPGGATGIQNALAASSPAIIGGTSVSTPVFAGIVTLLNQKLGGSGLGNINPKLYSLAATPSNGAFHAVNANDPNNNNLVYCTVGTPSGQPAALLCPPSGVFGYQADVTDATTGYNLVTGLGSVDADKLAIAWAATIPGFSMSATPLSPASVTAGGTTTSTVTVTPQNGFSGTVSFSCSSLPTGATCGFSPTTVATSGTTQLTIQTTGNMPASTTTVTVTGTSGGTSSSTTVSLTVTAEPPQFTLTPQTPSFQVAQGANIDATVNVTFNPGFSGTVSFTCAEPSTLTASMCTVPSPINATGAVSFHITTALPTASLQRPDRRMGIFYAALLPGLLGIVFAAGSRPSVYQRGMRIVGFILVLGCSTLWLASCSGTANNNISNPGTPKGTYTITVTGTSATAPTESNTFTLVVQ